ncbi:MAG TPA: hypothetical protein VFB08_21530 [Burkholderiales bacterium]|nr:hypothetical protein [Burkholderiales bacterium]
MEKEYGRLTADQFRRLIRELPEVRAGARELPELLRTATSEKVREVLEKGIYWAAFYELSFTQHLAVGLTLMGQEERFIELSKAEDPQEAAIQWAEEDVDTLIAKGKDFTVAGVLAAVISMQRSVFSLMLYKRSMSALLAEVREGNDDSLFLAVRVDRSAVACPSIAKRISKAQMLDQKRFFERLRSAIKGPSKKHWELYSDLRYSLAVLREMGFDSMSDAQLEHLLVDVLKVYPASFTARKNLRKQYYESKKITRI